MPAAHTTPFKVKLASFTLTGLKWFAYVAAFWGVISLLSDIFPDTNLNGVFYLLVMIIVVLIAWANGVMKDYRRMLYLTGQDGKS